MSTQTRMTPGLRRQILEYFQANPEEELTARDILVKFNASARNVESTLYRMRDRGELIVAHVWRKP